MPAPNLVPAAGSAGVPNFPTRAAAVTKSDSTVFAEPSVIYVGTAGDVVVTPWDLDAQVTFKAVPAGSYVPCQVKQVYSTNTSASDMVRVY